MQLIVAIEAFTTYFTSTHEMYSPQLTQPSGFIVVGIEHLVIAFMLLKFGPFLASLFYPSNASVAHEPDSP
jgi:hypothetical protein